MIEVVVPIYYKQTKSKVVMVALNWYRNVHYLTNNKAKMFYNSLIADTIEGEPILEGEIHVHFKIFWKRRGVDGGNIRSIIEKYALDGIIDAGYIIDDNVEIITSDSSEYLQDKKYPRAEITLTKKDE